MNDKYDKICIHGDIEIIGMIASYPIDDCITCRDEYGFVNPECDFYFAYKWAGRDREGGMI